MMELSDNPKRQNRIMFLTAWLGLPSYMFLMTDFKLIFLLFIVPGIFVVYLSTKIRDVSLNGNSLCIKSHKKSWSVPLTEISSFKHYNRGVYKMCFHNKKLVGPYILFYGKTKKWLALDGDFEHFVKQINT